MTILPFTVTMVISFFIRFEKTCIEITYFQYNYLSNELAPPLPPKKKSNPQLALISMATWYLFVSKKTKSSSTCTIKIG